MRSVGKDHVASVGYLKRLHQRYLDPLDLLERGSYAGLKMMNLFEILAVGPLVEPLVGPCVARLYDEPLVVPLVVRLYDVPLLVERLYDVPLVVEPLVVPCNDALLLLELLKYDSHLHPLVVEPLVLRGLSHEHKVVSKSPRDSMWQLEQAAVVLTLRSSRVVLFLVNDLIPSIRRCWAACDSAETLGLIVQHLLVPRPLALVSRRVATQAGW